MAYKASDYLKLVPTPARSAMNTGFSPARHDTMLALLGKPGPLSQNCTDPTGEKVVRLLTRKDVGPFFARGLSPAVASLTLVFADLKRDHPILHDLIGTEGMTCCRAVRGSTTHWSNHSWGTAVDLTIGGILAPLNATKIPYGLIAAYPYFHRYGWFWAAGYNGRTDPMHMETAQETLLRWRREGLI